MDTTRPLASAIATPSLVQGEFAPVFWEPLGKRGERLVVGILLTDSHQITRAHITLHHKQLLDFVTESQTQSAAGLIGFAFDYFGKTLGAGGIIQDLRAPFASMSIGRTEPISARTDEEMLERAQRLCTLLGYVPTPLGKPDAAQVAAKTMGFVRDVRQAMAIIDKKLTRLAMKKDQFYPVGNSQMRVHFQHDGRYAQFCSLPLPNARVELATEWSARLSDLVLIRKTTPSAKVALCINTQALAISEGYNGPKNATLIVQEKALAFASAMGIEAQTYDRPAKAASFLRAMLATSIEQPPKALA